MRPIDGLKALGIYAWFAIDAATLVFLVFFDGTRYNWWNWMIIIPIDIFLATIWPVYWIFKLLQ